MTPAPEHEDPMLYPWTPPQHSGLMVDDQVIPFTEMRRPVGKCTLPGGQNLDAQLMRKKLPTTDERHLVVAVGANASPAVMARKLTAGTLISTPVVPFVRSNIKNMNVGHAGYSSVRGYIPATPYHNDGSSVSLWASYLDDDQIEILDATEPNYHRVKVSTENYPMTLSNGETPEYFWIYDSYRGVLADGNGNPYSLSTQEELHHLLKKVDMLSSRFGDNVAKNMLEFKADINRPNISDLFHAAGVVSNTNIIFQEKCRTEKDEPTEEELADLEKYLNNTK